MEKRTLDAASAAGERCAHGGSGGEGGGDAGDDFVRDACGGERGYFFGGAAEEEWVSALEADDALAGLRVLDHERVDFILRDGLGAAALADVDDYCVRRGEREDCGWNEVVMENDVRGLDEAQGFNREQVGIAGACAYEVDFAAFNRRARELARGAGGRVADVPLCELMEQELAGFAALVGGEDFAAESPNFCEPGAEVGGELVVDFAT